MERGDQLQKVRKELGQAEFERRYPHLWLIRELEVDERAPSSFGTGPWDSRKTLAAGFRPRTSPGAGMAARLRSEPGRYGLYPLVKSNANPWADRILVGRASNNDIVLRHESISKVHAYFEKAEGGLHLHDAKSANGTQIDGKPVEPGGPGGEIKSGSVVTLGTLVCEIIATDELYEAL
jgi:FHA domain